MLKILIGMMIIFALIAVIVIAVHIDMIIEDKFNFSILNNAPFVVIALTLFYLIGDIFI